MFSVRQIPVVIAVVLVTLQCACRTDPLFKSRHKTDAPLTSLDRPEGVDVPDLVVVDAQEVDLVEAVLANRAVYFRSLEALRDFYRRKGHHRKQQWADQEIADVRRIQPFKYILDGEIPSTRLRPTDSIPEADALYSKARELLKQGGHKIPALYREDLMLEALKTFRQLITSYPSSDKIDDAAYYCGEIHKEYFKDQEEIALRWYERAWTWDPDTPHPARFQAAAVCDYRLHDRARALEHYHQVLEYEADHRSNAAFAVTRIHFLTQDLEPGSPPSTDAKSPDAPADEQPATEAADSVQ